MRIVSLVPSLTETIASWGLLDSLVGRTSYCEEPIGAIEAVEDIGGTKNPDVARIIALAPDLVVVNKEENRAEDAEALRAAGLALHVTHPRSVEQAAAMIEELGGVLDRRGAARDLAARTLSAVAACEAARAGREPLATFCPIWRKPWMTFRADTYIGDVLAVAGFANVFGQGLESGDKDFFEVTLEVVVGAQPAAVLLPDEPFCFESKHADELTSAGVVCPKRLIDGKAIAWYGPRMPDALASLMSLRATF